MRFFCVYVLDFLTRRGTRRAYVGQTWYEGGQTASDGVQARHFGTSSFRPVWTRPAVDWSPGEVRVLVIFESLASEGVAALVELGVTLALGYRADWTAELEVPSGWLVTRGACFASVTMAWGALEWCCGKFGDWYDGERCSPDLAAQVLAGIEAAQDAPQCVRQQAGCLCYICNLPGHKADECPRLRTPTHGSLPPRHCACGAMHRVLDGLEAVYWEEDRKRWRYQWLPRKKGPQDTHRNRRRGQVVLWQLGEDRWAFGSLKNGTVAGEESSLADAVHAAGEIACSQPGLVSVGHRAERGEPADPCPVCYG